MAITINGSTGITSSEIADGTITASDISSSDVKSLKSGRKNLIINGGFDVWQRGTSGTGNYGYISPDRWMLSYTTGAINLTMERVTNTNPSTSSTYALRIHSGGAAIPSGANQRVQTKFEKDIAVMSDGSARDVTLSFWAKSANSNVLTVYGGLSSQSLTANLTTSWQKFTKTFTGSITQMMFYFNNSSALDIQLAEVQLELGSVATDFEHRSYGEELALCQRYYQLNQSGAGKYSGTGSTSFAASVPLAVPMRNTPTLTLLNGTSAIDELYVSRRNITTTPQLYEVHLDGDGNFQGCQAWCSASACGSGLVGLFIANRFSLDAEL